AHGERPPLRRVGAVRSRRGWAPRALGGPPETSSPIAASKAANGNARRRPSLGPRARRGRWHPAPGAHPVDRRRAHPKQYCRIVGDRSLLETTLARIAPLVRRERTLAIVNRGHLSLARPQLAAIPTSNVLVQPQNLDTGPGLLVSLLALARRDAGRDGGRLPERSRHPRRDRLPAARGPHGVSRGHRAHLEALRVVPPWRAPLSATA